MAFFTEQDNKNNNKNPDIHVEAENPKAKASLAERDITIPDLRIYCRAVVTKQYGPAIKADI